MNTIVCDSCWVFARMKHSVPYQLRFMKILIGVDSNVAFTGTGRVEQKEDCIQTVCKSNVKICVDIKFI